MKNRLDTLADRIKQDIRRRGLQAGDRYLTAAEAAQMLRVSPATANRAMKLLADKQMLVRRRNAGSFVGSHFARRNIRRLRTVYAVTPFVELGEPSFPFDLLIQGIRGRMGDVSVQASFLPAHDPLDFTRELVHTALSAGEAAGFVPISCPHDVYRRLADSGVPTVIFGTPFVDQQDIASLDVDNREAGRLLVEHLLEHGHRRIGLLSPAEGRPGDNCFFDGVSEALTMRRMPHNALIARIVPSLPAAIVSQLEQFAQWPDPPTALIARSPALAHSLAAATASHGVIAARFEIAYQNHPATSKAILPFVRAEPIVSFIDIAARIGEMLERLGRGERLEEPHVVVPVALRA